MQSWKTLAVLLGVVAVIAIGQAMAWQPERAAFGFVAWAALPTVLLGGLASVWLRREEGDLRLLAPRWGDPTLGILLALVLYGGAWLLGHQLAPAGEPQEIWMVHLYLRLGPQAVLKQHMLLLVLGLLVFSLANEALWRGAVLRLCEPLVGSRRAWIVSAVLYALAYLPTYVWSSSPVGRNPLLVLGVLGAGLVLGGVVRLLGRAFPGILAQLLVLWAIITLFPLTRFAL